MMEKSTAVILAGGLGTRLSEETHLKPKPMVEVGGKPILWHIMKSFATYGVTDFIVCCGYRGYVIKEYFANYFLHNSDVTFDLRENRLSVLNRKVEPWTVTLVDTGLETQTGGRLKRVQPYLEGKDRFFFTYGDGVSDLDFEEEMSFHLSHQKLATVAAVKPPGRFGALVCDYDCVTAFSEKTDGDGNWINGGFFILEHAAIDYINDDTTVWEQEPLERLATEGELMAYRHSGFWQAMDTLRDKNGLERMWQEGNAPWKSW
ncbi:MAG: glucose-1-phosphate cytidylyltransferase [Pseudomonadota bacterium]|nr:glucose-1-phosphate cytidylyltransferase [Pseudomonadota bacterium]